jgi:hypothetical protein
VKAAATSTLLAVVLLCATGGASTADDGATALLNAIIADWNRRQAIAATIIYDADGEMLVTRGRFNDQYSLPFNGQENIPDRDSHFATRVRWVMDLQKNFLRKEFDGHIFDLDKVLFIPRSEIQVFDGAKLLVHQPRAANTSRDHTPSQFQPDVEIREKGDWGRPVFTLFDYPIFFAHGIIPRPRSNVRPDKLRISMAASDWRVSGKAIHGGRECVILRSAATPDQFNSYVECWIDVERMAAVARFFFYTSNNLWAQVDTDYHLTSQGWMPKNWKSTYYATDGTSKILTTDEAKTVRFTVNPAIDPGEFQIRLTPEMIVYQANTETLNRVRSDGTLEEIDPDSTSDRPTRNWYVVGGLALAAVACLWLGMRLKRKLTRSAE